jgi:hypothetical protein
MASDPLELGLTDRWLPKSRGARGTTRSSPKRLMLVGRGTVDAKSKDK